ncbi:zinc finger domain-containing protein [Streptomyces bobili]
MVSRAVPPVVRERARIRSCPNCHAAPGEPCTPDRAGRSQLHRGRISDARRALEPMPLYRILPPDADRMYMALLAGTFGQRVRFVEVTGGSPDRLPCRRHPVSRGTKGRPVPGLRPAGAGGCRNPAGLLSTPWCRASLRRGNRLGCRSEERPCDGRAGAMVSAASRGTVRQERPWRTKWLQRSSARSSMPGGRSSSITWGFPGRTSR